MRNVHGESHVRKMKPVAKPNERNGDDVVCNELLEIFSGFLQLQEKHDGLLRPVGCLHQVISLEIALVSAMGKVNKHCRCVKIPYWTAAHDEKAVRAKESKVNCSVRLFHEARLFSLGLDPTRDGPWTEESLHNEFPCEGQNDHVEADKGEVTAAFAILRGFGPVRRTIILLCGEWVSLW